MINSRYTAVVAPMIAAILAVQVGYGENQAKPDGAGPFKARALFVSESDGVKNLLVLIQNNGNDAVTIDAEDITIGNTMLMASIKKNAQGDGLGPISIQSFSSHYAADRPIQRPITLKPGEVFGSTVRTKFEWLTQKTARADEIRIRMRGRYISASKKGELMQYVADGGVTALR